MCEWVCEWAINKIEIIMRISDGARCSVLSFVMTSAPRLPEAAIGLATIKLQSDLRSRGRVRFDCGICRSALVHTVKKAVARVTVHVEPARDPHSDLPPSFHVLISRMRLTSGEGAS